jgi:hypothetical protein
MVLLPAGDGLKMMVGDEDGNVLTYGTNGYMRRWDPIGDQVEVSRRIGDDSTPHAAFECNRQPEFASDRLREERSMALSALRVNWQLADVLAARDEEWQRGKQIRSDRNGVDLSATDDSTAASQLGAPRDLACCQIAARRASQR